MRKTHGYWTEERVITDLKAIIEEIGRFPVDNDLRSLNRFDLRVAIEKHGGISRFRKLMNHEKKNSHINWTEKGVLEELETMIINLGYLPTGPQLKKLKRGDLLNAINKYGGYIKFRILLSKKLQNQEF